MRPLQRAAFILTAAAASVLCMAGCSTSGRVAASSDGPPTATAAARPAASAVSPSFKAPAAAVTFTFPDGRLSFTHPAGWRVEHEQVSASPSVETAAVLDGGGKQQINIYYSQIGDAQAGPADRHVLETEPVPGLAGQGDATPQASFFVDRRDGAPQYRMRLTAGLPVSPDGKVQNAPVLLGGRVLSADVLFSGQPFVDDEAAKAWYWSGEGQALKAVLVSFSYR